jgi:hypothetical protein
MSLLEKVRPGIRPCFFSQKIEAKEPEKKTLSTAVKVVRDPTEGPVGLALNARNCFDGVEEVIALGGVLDVSICSVICMDEHSIGGRRD